MGVDTFVIVPTRSKAEAKRLLRENPELDDDSTQLGLDFVALYEGDRFADVKSDPSRFGAHYASELPQRLRVKLDAKGLLVVAEVGQSFDGVAYAEIASSAEAMWLPVTPARGPRRRKRLLLVHLSPSREQRLIAEPDLIRAIVDARSTQPVPNALDLNEAWIDLQKLLFDFQWESGDVDFRAEALTPREGLPLYEDKSIDSALLVKAERADAIANWLLSLPKDIVGRVSSRGVESPASRNFPASLGSSEADDAEESLHPKKTRRRPPDPASLEAGIGKLRDFYEIVRRSRYAVLAIRFRG